MSRPAPTNGIPERICLAEVLDDGTRHRLIPELAIQPDPLGLNSVLETLAALPRAAFTTWVLGLGHGGHNTSGHSILFLTPFR